MPATHITNTISQVSFPAYAKIQNDLPRLREAYLKVLQITALVSMPTAFLIFTLGPDFVRLFLVEESHAMIPVIQILSLRSLLGSIGGTRGPLFRAIGKPQITLKLHCLRLLILSIIIYPLTFYWGIIGTTIAVVTMALFVNSIAIHKAKKILQCSVWDLRRPAYIPFVSSIVMSLAFFLIRYFIIKTISYLSFSFLLIFSISSYFCLLWILDGIYPNGIQAIIREHFKSFKKRAKKNKA
jgi:O-antigen/teichoic acid export membrane protein